MRQTTLCVPLEVKPESCSRLSALVEQLKARADGNTDDNFRIVRDRVPVLHFMSMSVFPAAEYDAMFILEANFDGAAGPFWAQLEAAFGEELRGIVRCCKRPMTDDGALYDAITRPDSRVPVAGYFEARTQRPSVFHHGNRGLERDRILDDHALFLALEQELDRPTRLAAGEPNPYRTAPVEATHAAVRSKLLARFPSLNDPPPVRISPAESRADSVRLILFLVLTLLVLSVPGLILALLFWDDRLYWLVLLLAGAVVWSLLYSKRKALSGTEVINRVQLPWLKLLPALCIGALVYVPLAVLVLSPILLLIHGTGLLTQLLGIAPQPGLSTLIWGAVRVVLLGLASAVLIVLPLLVLVVRTLEMRDSSQDAPPVDSRILREIARREDWITQNHMGSIVLIKPGVLRMLVIRAGHLGLGLFLRVQARDGYLGSMRTVHFAHWAFLNNGSRLLFFSNFDHSWGSYLDDFIEKAHAGLTLAWGCGVGFPATRMLVLDGASHGRQFKQWALASRAVSRFWYSAYRDLTVDQIERNHRIANGLRKPSLTAAEAELWALDL